jgi:hypothetical protein
MDVCLLCLYVVLFCVGRGLWDGLITRPEESYRVSNCVWSGNPEKGGQRSVLDYKHLWIIIIMYVLYTVVILIVLKVVELTKLFMNEGIFFPFSSLKCPLIKQLDQAILRLLKTLFRSQRTLERLEHWMLLFVCFVSPTLNCTLVAETISRLLMPKWYTVIRALSLSLIVFNR